MIHHHLDPAPIFSLEQLKQQLTNAGIAAPERTHRRESDEAYKQRLLEVELLFTRTGTSISNSLTKIIWKKYSLR